MKRSRSSVAKARDGFRNNASATAYSAPWGLFSKLFYLILAASISAQTWLWIVNRGEEKDSMIRKLETWTEIEALFN